MEQAVPDDGAAQLVTPAKAAVGQPSQSAEPFVSDCEHSSFSEPSMLSPGSPLATVAIESAHQQKGTAQSPFDKTSKEGPDEQLKPSTSSPSSRGGSEREREQPVVPKRGRRKPWRYPGLHTSSSYRQLTTVGGCHQYTISGYALARSLGPGTRMCSDLFEAGGQQFRLEIYPAGVSADAARHVSVFLTTPASLNPNHIIYEIAVLDQSGRNRHLVHSSKPQQGPCMMPLSGVVAGYPCFVRHALLDKHARRYLLNDCLIVRATVEIVRSWSAAPQQLATPGSMAITALPYSQPLQPDLSSYPGHCNSIPARAAGMHTAALHSPAVATLVPPAAVVHVGPAAAAGRSDVTVYCSCPACQVSNCCTSAQGYSAGAAAAGHAAGLCTAGPAQNAAANAAAEDGSSCARGAGAQSPAAAVPPAKQYQQRTATPLPAAAATEQPCTCIACLTAQLQQLQHALGLQPSVSPVRTHLGPADQFGSCSPPAACAAAGAAQLSNTCTYQAAVRPAQPVQYCSPVRSAVPSSLVYLASPQESVAAAAGGMYASPVYWSPQQQQQPQFVQPVMAPYAGYYSSASPVSYANSPIQQRLQGYNGSPQRYSGSQLQYSSMGGNYMQPGPAPLAGVVDVQELGSEAGLAVPVARHHPVRVQYS